MKRVIAAVVLLIIVVSTYIGSYIYINHVCEETLNKLDKCITSYSENKNSEKEAKNLDKYWNKMEKSLSIVVNHGKIDDIEYAIGALKVYSKSSEEMLFYEYSEAVKTHIHQLKEDTGISFHSIF